jgi:hypothetical protein
MKNKKWMGALAGALVAGLAAAWWAKRRQNQASNEPDA